MIRFLRFRCNYIAVIKIFENIPNSNAVLLSLYQKMKHFSLLNFRNSCLHDIQINDKCKPQSFRLLQFCLADTKMIKCRKELKKYSGVLHMRNDCFDFRSNPVLKT